MIVHTKESVEEKVKDIIFKESSYLANGLSDNTKILNTHNLESDLKFDSLDFVELIMVIEDEFNDREQFLTDEELETIKTVQDVINSVVKLKGL